MGTDRKAVLAAALLAGLSAVGLTLSLAWSASAQGSLSRLVVFEAFMAPG